MVAGAVSVPEMWGEGSLYVDRSHSYDTGAAEGMEPVDAEDEEVGGEPTGNSLSKLAATTSVEKRGRD